MKIKIKSQERKRMCCNCGYATPQFKVKNLNHVHCMKPKYNAMTKAGHPPSPWETLCVFSWVCEEHKFKGKK